MSSTPIDKVLAALPDAKRKGNSWTACCPAHDDHHPSLSISQGDDGRALVYCHTGCEQSAVIQALKLSASDLMPDSNTTSSFTKRSKPPAKPKKSVKPKQTFKTAADAIASLGSKPDGVWEYTNGYGEPVGYVTRFNKGNGKSFVPVSRVNGDWIVGGMPEPRPLYRLPDLDDAETVYVCEGEKTADAVIALGLTATTSPNGSKSASKADWLPLSGKRVCILPDHDEAGEGFADDVLKELAKCDPLPEVSIVRLPNLPPKGDAFDWIEAERESGTDDSTIAMGLSAFEQSTKLIDLTGHTEKPAFTFYTAAEFDVLDMRREYHIPGVLAAGPVPTILSGAFKTLKTSIGMDLFISLATGSRFLNHYDVNQTRVGIMSGESGGFALQDMARRIAQSKGWTFGSIGNTFRISTGIPNLGDAEQMQSIERFIVDNEIKLLGIDPTYLAMRGLRSDDAGNMFKVGEFLEPLARIGERTGCTPMIVHHNSKGATRASAGEPAELADIAWSGFAEWVGQWVLLARREKYDPDSNGEHALWMTAGGRDGHSTLVGVNVTEGHQDDPGGRRWDVQVEQATAVRADTIETEAIKREERNEQKHKMQIEQNRVKILARMQKLPDGDTKSGIRDQTGINSTRFNQAFALLIENETVVQVQVTKCNGQKYEGYKLHSDPLGLTRTNTLLSECPTDTGTHSDNPP